MRCAVPPAGIVGRPGSIPGGHRLPRRPGARRTATVDRWMKEHARPAPPAAGQASATSHPWANARPAPDGRRAWNKCPALHAARGRRASRSAPTGIRPGARTGPTSSGRCACRACPAADAPKGRVASRRAPMAIRAVAPAHRQRRQRAGTARAGTTASAAARNQGCRNDAARSAQCGPPRYFFSPAVTRRSSRFSGGASGQVANAVNAHGGL